MAPPPPDLMEELVEEILLCFPPDEPARLVRAALVCKRWCRLVSGPGFRRRFRELHRTPPMLGFLCSSTYLYGASTRFVPTTAFCSPLVHRPHCRALDARHGRVLLRPLPLAGTGMEPIVVVWDPITDEQSEIQIPKPDPSQPSFTLNAAAVVCAATARGACACDHLDCHRGPFLVVFMLLCHQNVSISTYSSDTGSCSEPIFTQHHNHYVNYCRPPTLVGNALYFGFFIGNKRILKYDLELHEMSAVGLPPTSLSHKHHIVLRDAEGLEFAILHESKLYMWSRNDGPEADAVWTQGRVIDLEMPLRHVGILTKPVMVGFAEQAGVIFLKADNLLYTVDLKTYKVKEACKGKGVYTVIPYVSFYTPALGGALRVEGTSASV